MFKFKLKGSENQSPAISTSFMGAGAVFTGNLECQGDIRIDGTIKGNVRCMSKIVLGPEGVIEGDVFTREADIMGRVDGRVWTNELLYMRNNATVNGDILASKLMIDPTASFNGQCKMGANIVDLNTGNLSLALNG